jgi:hypothetical protein
MIYAKGNSTMKKIALFLCLLIVLSLACDVSVNIAPTNDVPTVAETPVLIEPPTTTPEVFISLTQAIPATAIPSATPLAQPSPVAKTSVTFGRLSLDIPSSVANGASGKEYPRNDSEDAPYWDKTPGHLQVSLNDYYILQGKLHQPQIYVYPAMPYVELSTAAFESMHRLRNVMNPGASITANQLPTVPFFNAAQVFASNIQAVSFQNGSGIRFLTEYGQYPAPVNNHELFYHFQGFTNDGEYYIVAIFPITAPGLGESSDPESAVAIGGVAYPSMGDPSDDWEAYYTAAANLLDATSPESFTPSLSQLDALIQSMWVAP